MLRNIFLMYIVPTTYFCEQFKSQTSIYTGVGWKQNINKWQTRLTSDKKTCFGGYFDDEEYAAMKINSLCNELSIQRKNPIIDINLNEIQPVTHSLSIIRGKRILYGFH